jgi:hypothetical protein
MCQNSCLSKGNPRDESHAFQCLSAGSIIGKEEAMDELGSQTASQIDCEVISERR